MTQEDKELLLKDLSARLPYGVRIYAKDGSKDTSFVLKASDLDWIFERIDEMYDYDGWKPYLRPMSSMTVEELHELAYKVLQQPDLGLVKNTETLDIRFSDLDTLTTWLNKHHFDYRGLIKKGLAIEALKEMYK